MVISQIDTEVIAGSKKKKKTIDEMLPVLYGDLKYLDLVKNLELTAEAPMVFQLMLDHPNHEIGVNASYLILDWNGIAPYQEIIDGSDKNAKLAVVQNLGHVYDDKGKSLLKEVVLDNEQAKSLRRRAIESLGLGCGYRLQFCRDVGS